MNEAEQVMKNSADQEGCYPQRPSASVDNTLRDLQDYSFKIFTRSQRSFAISFLRSPNITRPCPQVFAVNGSIICNRLHLSNCGRQKEPAILISTLLLQTHAPQLYSLVSTRFCWNLESFTTNAWNAKNAIFWRVLRVTFGPWITWRSCIAAAPTNPNRACQFGFDVYVHDAISRPYSVVS